MQQSEILWQLVKDNFEQARAHEQYREKIVSLVITLCGALFGVLAIQSLNITYLKIVYAAIFVFGAYGALVSAKHYERFRMHIAIAQRFLDMLRQDIKAEIDFNGEFRGFQKGRSWKHSRLASLDLNWFWTGFPASIAIGGLVLLVFEVAGISLIRAR